MAKDPIVTLIELNDVIVKLNATQNLIDYGRTVAPRDQLYQLELDRKQAEVDHKRAFVAMTMADIRNRN